MTFDDRWNCVAVIGAAGKMGSGIALLAAQEMTRLKLMPENKDKSFQLILVDINPNALNGLRKYIRDQSEKTAEKTCIQLRKVYSNRPDLVENTEIIQQYIEEVDSLLWTTTDIESIKDATMVFEAVIENEDLKQKLLSKAAVICKPDTYFLSNTSSIPIQGLSERSGISSRLVGFHFYNPPAVQKLVEIITAKNTQEELIQLSQDIIKRLRKKMILSNDIAGFIGNGHFIRDGLHAIHEVQYLMKEKGYTEPEAIYLINKVTADFLIRPMGIFQLIDYVGWDVFQCIQRVMDHYLEETLRSEWVDELVHQKILGGQYSDGRQKDGILQYDKFPVAVRDIQAHSYIPFSAQEFASKLDQQLGALPSTHTPWKNMVKQTNATEALQTYFKQLKDTHTLGAEIAIRYLKRSKEIGEHLVKDGVAHSPDDVNGVLMNGFFHVYGPIHSFVD